MTEEDQKHFDALQLAYDEYIRRVKSCGTYEQALKWIEQASAVSTEMYELKHGPLSISGELYT